MKRSLRTCAMSGDSNDSSSITWHQWHVEYRTLRKMGRSRARAASNASSPQDRQSTGLCACWSRYGDVSSTSRFVQRGDPSARRCRVRAGPRRAETASASFLVSSSGNGCAPGPGSMVTAALYAWAVLPGRLTLGAGSATLRALMRAYDLIRKKRDGGQLTAEELQYLVWGATTGGVADEQVAAFLIAVFFRGMDLRSELPAWLNAMLHSGRVLDLSAIPGRKVDKHSTGGVGDKISLVLAPLVAVCGVRVPMVSGRSLGHTGGTLDKLESIPGFSVDLSIARFAELVNRLGVCLIGQTAEIAPADRKLYALRDSTATVESIPLIASSILSKKLAEGIDALVLDVKVGRGAFMKELPRAQALARTMVDLCKAVGRGCTALITDMDAPLGYAVGNAVEVAESIDVLRGGGPADVRELTLLLGVEMLIAGEAPGLAGAADPVAEARRLLESALANAIALHRFI